MASGGVKCLQCGKCCWIEGHGWCSCLTKMGDGKMACIIYPIRLGTKIAEGWHCGKREDSKYDFEGCPFNTGKPIFKEFV